MKQFAKYFLNIEKNRKISVYSGMLFLVCFCLILITYTINFYNSFIANVKKNIPFNLINCFNCVDYDVESLKKFNYVIDVYNDYNLYMKYGNKYYKFNYKNYGFDFDLNSLGENEIIVQNDFAIQNNFKSGDEISFFVNEELYYFKINSIVDDIDYFDDVVFINEKTLLKLTNESPDNMYILIDDIDNYEYFVNKYDFLNVSIYSVFISDKITAFELYSNMLYFIYIFFSIITFLLLIIILNIVVDEERKNISLYRVFGFNFFQIIFIYFSKILIYFTKIYMLAVFFILCLILVFRFELYLDFLIKLVLYLFLFYLLIMVSILFKIYYLNNKKIINLLKD